MAENVGHQAAREFEVLSGLEMRWIALQGSPKRQNGRPNMLRLQRGVSQIHVDTGGDRRLR